MESTELRAMAARVRVIAQKREVVSVGSLGTIADALSDAAAEIELLNALVAHRNHDEDKRETHRRFMSGLTVNLR
jgi:hypothetical protein